MPCGNLSILEILVFFTLSFTQYAHHLDLIQLVKAIFLDHKKHGNFTHKAHILLYYMLIKRIYGTYMKNKYLLKSNINNAHRVICQDNHEVILEKIDSVFAKMLYPQTNTSSEQNQGLFASHVKGLNLLSKKSLSMNYADDEAIKKYNQKANVQTTQKDINDAILHTQKQNTQILSKHLKAKHNNATQHNDDFFNAAALQEQKNCLLEDKLALNSNLDSLKNLIAPMQIKQDREITQEKEKAKESEPMVLALVNPYKLRNYSFMIPEYLTLILHITKKSKLLVYCPLDLNSPLESSEINYLFPIIFNTETKFAAQIPLSIMDYPDFNKQKLRDFL